MHMISLTTNCITQKYDGVLMGELVLSVVVVMMNFGVVDLAAPYWSSGKSSPSIQVEEESNIEVDCTAHGLPRPNIAFMINGIPLAGK